MRLEADAGVDRLAQELDALRGELGAGRFDVGDAQGESGAQLAGVFRRLGYEVSAMAFLQAGGTGSTVRDCARELRVPYSEIHVSQFEDPYHVPRVLRALLEAPVAAGLATPGLVEKVMATKLVEVV